MNGAIDTTAAQERRVCRVYNRVNIQARNVADHDYNASAKKRRFSFRHWIRSRQVGILSRVTRLRRAA
jgi:hypothetical protein